MPEYFSVKTAVIRRACARAGIEYASLPAEKRYARLKHSENGEAKLTMPALEALSRKLRYPLAYLFLNEPASDLDKLPVEDFRTAGGAGLKPPSIDLCEQAGFCLRQQEWFSAYAEENGLDPIPFAAAFPLNDDPDEAGERLREVLALGSLQIANDSGFLRELAKRLERHKVIVEISRIVKSAPRRRLDIREFKGITLSDRFAPLIFVNGGDSASEQIFTLLYELGHICLGLSGVSDVQSSNSRASEIWCSAFAASALMPKKEFLADFAVTSDPDVFIRNAVNKHHVSTLAVLRRMDQLKLLSKTESEHRHTKAQNAYRRFLTRQESQHRSKTGGFCQRVSPLLAQAVIASARVGETPYRDALDLLALSSVAAFNKLASAYEVKSNKV